MRLSKFAALVIVISALFAQTRLGNSQATDTAAAPVPMQKSSAAVILEATLQAAVSATCGQMVLSLVPRIATAMPFVDTAMLNEFACRCTTERFMSDGELRRVLSMSDADVKTVMNSPRFKQLFTARLLGFSLECIGTHLNEQTNKAGLTF